MRARALLLGRESASSGVTASGSESLKTQRRFSVMGLHQMLLVCFRGCKLRSAQKFNEVNVMVTPCPMRPLGSQMGLKIYGARGLVRVTVRNKDVPAKPHRNGACKACKGKACKGDGFGGLAPDPSVSRMCVSRCLWTRPGRSKRRRRCRPKNVRKKERRK